MPQNTPIGERLRAVRKRRGLSQRELATASGVSLSLVRKLEQGEVQNTRMETARRLAVALRVPTTHLVAHEDTGPHEASEPWRPLQRAIEEPPQSPDGEPDMDGIDALLNADIRGAYFDRRLSDLSLLLTRLLREADALGDDPAARGTRAHLLQIAGSTLTQARQYPAAETALRRALDDAPDRLRAASIITTWSWLLVRQGRLDESRQLATRWADDVEPRLSRATPEDLAAWGWLLLQASAASLRDNRAGEAEDMMRLARAAAVRTGRELPEGTMRLASWGPVTVAYKAAERDIILDRPDSVLEMAERLDGAGQGGTEYQRHRLDVAKAHVMKRQYGQAVEVLDEVRVSAPEWLSQQRYAGDIMGEVIGHRRTLTPQMRILADAVNVPL
jgi:transcriptional regulator with XRE-family HTH domain